MGVRTVITADGVRQFDNPGAGNTLEVDTSATTSNVVKPSSFYMTTQTLSASVSTPKSGTISSPGFYNAVGGADNPVFTVPAASSYPGGTLVVRDSNNKAFELTGSATNAGGVVFVRSVNLTGSNPYAGTKLVAAGGNTSICLWSDGVFWYPTAGTGSFVYAGTPTLSR